MRILTRHTATGKFEPQFRERCDAWTDNRCDQAATWAAWSDHGTGHMEHFCYVCDGCRKAAEDIWMAYCGQTCSCGYVVDGTVDEHMRFIRL